ncbi:MAG: hypothetical protein LCH71_10260 [Proteobacteria bacterium]|nr:hypothetical protein [Pseudomonadota bacterium]
MTRSNHGGETPQTICPTFATSTRNDGEPGILAPLNHWMPHRFNNLAFIGANLAMDMEAIMYWFAKLPLPEHSWLPHSFLGATIIGLFMALLGISTREPHSPKPAWVLGSFLGVYSHVLLDMLVHAKLMPLYPQETNPFFMGWMGPVSWVTAPLCVWLIAQYVSYALVWVRRRWQAFADDFL